jgi:hypothetical protein
MFPKRTTQRLGYVALLFLFVPGSLSGDRLFKPAQGYPSGGAPSSVAIADVNGDGKPDLILANPRTCYFCGNPGGVGVLLGNGGGTFNSVQTYSVGGYEPESVAVADVNGDGKLDILVTGGCVFCDAGVLGVLLGNGDGTFQAVQTYALGSRVPDSMAVGDFNNDGKPDVAVSNNDNVEGKTVAVLLGNGNGTFQAPQNYSSGGSNALRIAVADVNGDGKTDLLVTAPGITGVLLGNGDGTFQESKTYSTGFDTEGIAVADVNGDGKLDLLVTGFSVAVLLGNGDGTFQAARTYSSGGFIPDAITVGDVNGDAKPDLLVVNYCIASNNCSGNKVVVLLGNGDGTFLLPQHYDAGGSYGDAIAIGDVSGDGKPDLVVAEACLPNLECDSGLVSVLLGTAGYRTTTNLSSSPNPSLQGQAVTLMATVSSIGPIVPTGKVKFKNGGTLLGSAILSTGVATLTKKNLPVGMISLTAVYQGDVHSAKSTSQVLVQVVNPAAGRSMHH